MSENQTQATPEISPAAYDIFVRKLFNRSGDPSKDFTHALLGIATEIDELLRAEDEVNGLEETGDLQFYIVALRQVIQDFTSASVPTDRDAISDAYDALTLQAAKLGSREVILGAIAGLLDIAKRWVGYGKAPEDFESVYNGTITLVTFAGFISEYGDADVGKAVAANVAKLSKRYKGGAFSQTDALIRDLEAEREALASA